MKYLSYLSLTILLLSLFGCKNDVLPKPNGHLRLDYETPSYKAFNNSCSYSFEVNSNAKVKPGKDCSFSIDYPKMKATIFVSYKSVQNNIDSLLRDAQKLTFEHVIKADDIIEQPFVNQEDRVFGMFYEVNGNAASQVQFYVTDSISNFVNCSVYFYAKPNYDSILPAADYIRNDVKHLMESFKWKK